MARIGSAACESCRFFDDHKSNAGASSDETGLCRFNPPVSQLDASTHGFWPVVASEDWCGHFTPESMPSAE